MTEYLRKLLNNKNASARRASLIEFKDMGRKGKNRRTLYFNAFTDDLFTRNNDRNCGNERVIGIIQYSSLLAVLRETEMENGIRQLFFSDIPIATSHSKRYRDDFQQLGRVGSAFA